MTSEDPQVCLCQFAVLWERRTEEYPGVSWCYLKRHLQAAVLPWLSAHLHKGSASFLFLMVCLSPVVETVVERKPANCLQTQTKLVRLFDWGRKIVSVWSVLIVMCLFLQSRCKRHKVCKGCWCSCWKLNTSWFRKLESAFSYKHVQIPSY